MESNEKEFIFSALEIKGKGRKQDCAKRELTVVTVPVEASADLVRSSQTSMMVQSCFQFGGEDQVFLPSCRMAIICGMHPEWGTIWSKTTIVSRGNLSL